MWIKMVYCSPPIYFVCKSEQLIRIVVGLQEMRKQSQNKRQQSKPKVEKGPSKLTRLKQREADLSRQGKQDKKVPISDNKNEPSHTLAQIKKQVSISSENFVICKATDFENDYQIVDKLGEGSFGSVFKVKHKVLGLERALKKIQKNPNAQFSSFEEIEILKKLDHSNILKIYQFYETDEYYMIVTDIFEGRELFDQIIDANKITQEIAARVVREVLKTLCYTHGMGIAHRDIKPENILVRHLEDESKFKIKIIDWGLGTLIQEGFSDRVCGTPQYAAPEVFQGKYSVLCDMWSLGVLCFIMMTGNMPFKGTNTQATISQVKRCIINYRKSGFNDLSQNAKEFITALIQKQPTKRMTAVAALEHQWLAQYQQQKKQPLFLQNTLVRLKQLNIANHFGVAVVNLINNHFSSSEERDRLEQIFKFLDSNGDGVLSKEELIEGYTRIYGKSLAQQIAVETFSKLDVNNSGTLEFSEFIAYGLRREKQKEKEKLKYAFDMFDEDKNGRISWNEIGKILESKLEGAYEEDMKKLVADVKQNGDNQIDFQNFYKFMEGLLERVDVIRSSRKKESMIKSQQKKRMAGARIESQSMQLKRTESIDEPIQNSEKQKIEKISNTKKKHK